MTHRNSIMWNYVKVVDRVPILSHRVITYSACYILPIQRELVPLENCEVNATWYF